MMRMFIAGAALATIFASPADAAVVTITWKGTVASATDGIGVFGAAGSNLVGSSFEAVYTVDTGTAGAVEVYESFTSYVGGGTNIGGVSPLTGKITINGNLFVQRAQIAGTVSKYYGSNTQYPGADVYGVNARNRTENGGDSLYDEATFDVRDQTASLFTDADFRTVGQYAVAGKMNQAQFNANQFVGGVQSITNIRFDVSTLQVAQVPSVPEPATWAMFLIGFGMIGAATRYRRRSTVTTFA